MELVHTGNQRDSKHIVTGQLLHQTFKRRIHQSLLPLVDTGSNGRCWQLALVVSSCSFWGNDSAAITYAIPT